MSNLTNGKMKCFHCKKDKPKSDFGKVGSAKVLCSNCRSGSIVNTSKGSSNGSWVGDLVDGIIDAVTDW
jgi:hypothetical protein